MLVLPERINAETPGWTFDPMRCVFVNVQLSTDIRTAAERMAKTMTWFPAFPSATEKRHEWGREFWWGSRSVCDYDDNGDEVPGSRSTIHSPYTESIPTYVIVQDMAVTLAATRHAHWKIPLDLRMNTPNDFGRNRSIVYYGWTEPAPKDEKAKE